jgi:signal transduction histidine kinase
MNNQKAPGRVSDRLFAALVGLGYLFAGLVWVRASDQAGSMLFSSADALTRFQTWKGTGFIAGTAVLVFVLAARGTRSADAVAWPARSGPGLSALLAALVLVTAAPLVLLLGYNLLQQTRGSVEEANTLVRSFAGSTATETQAFLRERQRLADRLARRPLVSAVDRANCDPLLAEITGLQEELRNVTVLDAAGQVVCGAQRGTHVAVTRGQLESQPGGVLSPPQATPGGPVFALTYPMRAPAGELVGGLQLLVTAGSLQRLVTREGPRGLTNTLVTMQGHLLARSPAVPARVGQRMPELVAFVEPLRRGQTSLVARGVDGVERFYALQRVGQSDVVAIAGVEVDQIFGPARNEALRSFGVAGAVLLLAALLIATMVRRIARPMRALSRAAEAVAAGQFDRRAPETGPREVAGVALQFNRMLDRLPALEHALRESEERHRTLLEKLSRNIPGMIFQLRMEPGGRDCLPFVSDGIQRLFEVKPEEAAQDAAAVLRQVHPDDAARVHASLAASRETLGDLALEYRVLLPQRGLRHYLTYAQPERLAGGGALWHGCTVDITALKEAQLALRQANEHLEARVAERTRELATANESLESFSYSVAHDLRAPLQAIEGFSEALPALLERGETERLDRLVQRIAANTAQMSCMIDGLLAVARAGKGQLVEQPVPLDALVAEVLAGLPRPAATVVQVGSLPTVRADAATLRQVWWNLLANAVKFSAQRTPARIEVGCERRVEECVFFVRDNGAGFEQQFAGRLFTAFQRLHEAHEFEGSGIGLALARRIVERHGGRVWAEGRAGEGACFYFSLPAARLVD